MTEPGSDQDELGHGPDRESQWSRRLRLPAWTRARWVRAAAGALAVLVVFTVVLKGPASAPTAGTAATPTAVSGAGPTISGLGRLPADFVAVGEICPPVTDGVHSLVVSFTLRNIADIPITVRSVQPLLPLGGLSAVSTDIAGGTCAQTTGAPADLVLPVGDNLVVTFRFLLPATCPQPLPIQARTQILVGPASSGEASGAPGVSLLENDVGVFDDLGGIHFDTCPATA